MNRFAFINSFLDTQIVRRRLRFPANRLPKQVLKKVIARMSPYRYMNIGPVRSSTEGVEALGVGIACPFLPEHFVTVPPEKVLQKLIASVRLGEHFGAKIVGLGGFTSVFGNEGEEVAKHVKVGITSGNTYTAALAIQGILKASEMLAVNLAKCRVAVVGATGDIGGICTKILAKYVGEVVLAARNEKRLEVFASDIASASSVPVRIAKYTRDAVKDSDLILCATSAITTIIEPEELKSGAIVCDVAYPANITHDIWKTRNDVFVFEGGLASWSHYDSLEDKVKLQDFAPPGTIHGCLAETMLLALEGRTQSYSLGRGRITEESVKEIEDIARRHGFELAPFHCGGFCYSLADIKRIRERSAISKEDRFSGTGQTGDISQDSMTSPLRVISKYQHRNKE